MKISVVYSEERCLKEIEKGVDIIVSPMPGRLFGMFLFTTNRNSMLIVYKNYQYREAILNILNRVSRFAFPNLTKKRLLDLLEKIIKDVVIVDYEKESVLT